MERVTHLKQVVCSVSKLSFSLFRSVNLSTAGGIGRSMDTFSLRGKISKGYPILKHNVEWLRSPRTFVGMVLLWQQILRYFKS